MNARLQALSDAGVSIWLDDLSRERLASGNLAELVAESSVVGVTTNPTIFAAALANGERYAAQVAELKAAGTAVDDTIFELTTTDVQEACDVLRPVYESTDGVDGRVSIEVDPGAARDTDSTVALAQKLWARVDRPNLLIKIPATEEGLPAIAATIAKGISVNVTLIFAIERYGAVMDAYLYGLEQAAAEGRDLSTIHSVASFFISRVDSEVDARLPEDSPLRGKAGLANARLAYAAYAEVFGGERFAALAQQGARPQRPLWASTGVKNPDLPDTLYLSDLVVAGTVNTVPEKTLQAFADHGEVRGDTVTGTEAESQQVIDQLAEAGIDYDEVVKKLEDEGLQKFDDSWAELVQTVSDALDEA
ncbi:transaldolase [Aeromicrobium sp. Leaf350]|uniref:transaldolase n=1 Tax=Aeromicrobium sp. Leaf350 TaxID=2876565 RepID=UPI001E327D20|nr:transaldolase [Aeromicrobium sp. Leaf350]